MISFAMLMAYSIAAEITFPENATVPSGVFRTSILETLTFVLIMGVLLFVHYVIQQSRTFLQARAYQKHLDTINLTGYEDAR